MRARRAIRRSMIGVPAVGLLLGALVWLLGLTPLPPAPAAATELLAVGRRASVMARGLPVQSWHVPTIADWVRARSVQWRTWLRGAMRRLHHR